MNVPNQQLSFLPIQQRGEGREIKTKASKTYQWYGRLGKILQWARAHVPHILTLKTGSGIELQSANYIAVELSHSSRPGNAGNKVKHTKTNREEHVLCVCVCVCVCMCMSVYIH